ncbi:DUF2780 domain-containing protein [Schlesneria paludicola]|uniref:DUF2780 domain-containing protein n=1 Tax=Schlesneria paludicola TaxID=360056 RepID=UPI0002FB9A71|nr:DUF2780 domain-containing protein [Schlesneria paludicola]
MVDLVQTISSQTGIPAETVKKAIGSVLSFLKDQHGEDALSGLKQSLPTHNEMLAAYENSPSDGASNGLLNAVAGLASKFLGGGSGDGAKLLQGLGRAGLGVDQISVFLPKLIEHFESLLSPEIVAKIKAILTSAAATSTK